MGPLGRGVLVGSHADGPVGDEGVVVVQLHPITREVDDDAVADSGDRHVVIAHPRRRHVRAGREFDVVPAGGLVEDPEHVRDATLGVVIRERAHHGAAGLAVEGDGVHVGDGGVERRSPVHRPLGHDRC